MSGDGLCRRHNKFPSAINGKGFKPLADYVYSLGLKFGVHLMRGIPRQAVAAKTSCPTIVRGCDPPLLMRLLSTCFATSGS